MGGDPKVVSLAANRFGKERALRIVRPSFSLSKMKVNAVTYLHNVILG